ncbi:MAG TPA: YIP1 family protein [Thermodesulfobacteriota bacterium]|nr:YIP1 family protein [Thermodesulfobacteriota bacterium]
MAGLIDRMVRASKLDVSAYEEVEADKGATGQAAAIVVVSSIAAGIGSIGVFGMQGLLYMTIGALVGWLIWAFLTFIIGTKLLPEPQTKADMGEMLRTIGFSSSPGVLRILGVIPVIGGIINFVIGIWMLVAMIIAVRQALDYKSTWRAAGVCIIGFIVYFVVMFFIFKLIGVNPAVEPTA